MRRARDEPTRPGVPLQSVYFIQRRLGLVWSNRSLLHSTGGTTQSLQLEMSLIELASAADFLCAAVSSGVGCRPRDPSRLPAQGSESAAGQGIRVGCRPRDPSRLPAQGSELPQEPWAEGPKESKLL